MVRVSLSGSPPSSEQGNNGGNGTASFSVSQVNTGQVTTFPYYLNSKTNASGTAGIKVAQTHEQYFQLNMGLLTKPI